MKKYAVIVADLLLSIGCQTRNHETTSTMEPSSGTSYGTPGTRTQSGTSSSSEATIGSPTAIDSTANRRDAVQDNSSVLKEQSDQSQNINRDIGTPGVKSDTGNATESSQPTEKANNPEALGTKDNPALPQPDQAETPNEQSLTTPPPEPLVNEDTEAILKTQAANPEPQVP